MCVETWVGITTIAANAAVVLGIAFAVWDVFTNRRQKKQNTLEFYHDVAKDSAEFRDKINGVFTGEEPIDPDDERFTNEIKNTITKYLSTMERLSVGINEKVYDFGVYKKVAGSATVKRYDKVARIIKDRRKSNPRAYTDFEKLAEKLRKVYDREEKEEERKRKKK